MRPTCSHLDQVADIGPGDSVCPICVEMGSGWVHLRQCRICGQTACCDSSPNRHASAHFRETGHPIMRTLEADQTWSWCFVDQETLEQDASGAWEMIDPFFDAGLWHAEDVLANGVVLPFPRAATAGDFPLGQWEQIYRDRHRAGTLHPEQAAKLEALPGWHW